MSREGNCYFLGGGGTAGHINPALRIGEALKEIDPQADIYFIVSEDGLERKMVAEAGEEMLTISASELPHDFTSFFRFVVKTVKGIFRSLSLIRKHQPKVIIGTGGYVGAPLIVAARLCGVPILLHEQNAIPGKSNRRMAKFASAVCLSFAGSEAWFKPAEQKRCVLTGNPVKSSFFKADKGACRRELGVAEDAELVVIMGGSLGAKSINEAVNGLPGHPDWVLLTGEYPNVMLCLSGGSVNSRFLREMPEDENRIKIYPYIDSSLWMPAADLLVGRSGAGFLMEAAATGVPSVLIPFPKSADGHQLKNAQTFEAAGASVIVQDEELNSQILAQTIRSILSDKEKRNRMSLASGNLSKPDAAKDIALIARSVAGGKEKA